MPEEQGTPLMSNNSWMAGNNEGGELHSLTVHVHVANIHVCTTNRPSIITHVSNTVPFQSAFVLYLQRTHLHLQTVDCILGAFYSQEEY